MSLGSLQSSVLAAVKKRGKLAFIKPVGITGSTFGDPSHLTIKLVRPYASAVQVRLDGTVQAANGALGSVVFSSVVPWVKHPSAQRAGSSHA